MEEFHLGFYVTLDNHLLLENMNFRFTGPFAAFLSYLIEFHSSENRSRIQLLRGFSSGLAVIIIPMIAWGILPQVYEISILNISKWLNLGIYF